jgi:hypothetical protein
MHTKFWLVNLKGGMKRFIKLTLNKNIIRAITRRERNSSGHVERIGEMRNVYKVLVGKPEGKSQPGRPTSRMNL